MTLLESVKPFWPLLFTFILPKALNYYHALKTSIRTRPPPRPLPPKARRALNILFTSICAFLCLSFSTNVANHGLSNVFATTNTRIGAPADLLFSRLAQLRPNTTLTPEDEALKTKLLSMPLRQIYLRHGPDVLLSCSFCHADDPLSYTLHSLPTQILMPHLLQLLIIGLSTSKSVCGVLAARFRFRFAAAAVALMLLDIYVVAFSDADMSNINGTSRGHHAPFSLYATGSIFRPLLLCLTDVVLAFLIFVSGTNRFLLLPFLAAAADASDGNDIDDNAVEELVQETKKLLGDTTLKLQVGTMKLQGLNVTRNTIARNESLQAVEDRYWRTARSTQTDVFSDGTDMDQSLFEEEEVQQALARVFGGNGGSSAVDIDTVRREADGFVREMTRSLDL